MRNHFSKKKVSVRISDVFLLQMKNEKKIKYLQKI